MGMILRKLLWVLFVVAIGYGVYWAATSWWEGPFTWENAKNQAVETYEAAKRKVTSMTVETAKQEVSAYADRVVEEAEGGVVRYAKQKAGETLAGLGEKIVTTAGTISKGTVLEQSSVLLPTGAGFTVPAPLSALSVTVGNELVLSIAPGGTYEVQWGDAAADRGTVGQGAVRLVRHAWKKPGDYTVNVTVTIPDAPASSISFPVRVFSD
ncbi:MAG: hypothetical protein Q7S84_02050 [bacterium]|nr:hypothetical protein [bacterium]